MANSNKYISLLNLGGETYNLKDTGGRSLISNFISNTHMTVDKSSYTQYIGITSTNENYNKIIFVNDGNTGVGIIYQGKLYINSPYWIEVVDTLPAESDLAANTLYLVKE